jgi:hypothetical protein
MKPHHVHDCDACFYLGTTPSRNGAGWLVDMYVCPEMGYGSAVFRYGPNGNYAAGDLLIYRTPWSMMLTEDQFTIARSLMRHWRKHYNRRERMKQRRTTMRKIHRQYSAWKKDGMPWESEPFPE